MDKGFHCKYCNKWVYCGLKAENERLNEEIADYELTIKKLRAALKVRDEMLKRFRQLVYDLNEGDTVDEIDSLLLNAGRDDEPKT